MNDSREFSELTKKQELSIRFWRSSGYMSEYRIFWIGFLTIEMKGQFRHFSLLLNRKIIHLAEICTFLLYLLYTTGHQKDSHCTSYLSQFCKLFRSPLLPSSLIQIFSEYMDRLFMFIWLHSVRNYIPDEISFLVFSLI